jgi:tetratricopeptide (TPR) repeat protein
LAQVLAAPTLSAAIVGTRNRGDFLRGLELKETPQGGAWLRIASLAGAEEGDVEEEEGADGEEDEEEDVYQSTMRHLWGSSYFNRDHRRKPTQLWVRLQQQDGDTLVRVEATDCPHISDATLVEGEARDDAADTAAAVGSTPTPAVRRLDSLAAEFLDAPFIPQLGSGAAPAPGSAVADPAAAADSGAAEAALLAAALAASGGVATGGALPLGAAVVMTQLTGAESAKFNGVSGVVISLPGEGGRQGVRLNAPYSGKRLRSRPANMVPAEVAQRAAAEEDDAAAAASGAPPPPRLATESVPPALQPLARRAAVLGLTLSELGLRLAGSGADADVDDIGSRVGFRIGGCSADEALDAALRCAMRDALRDDGGAAAAAVAAHATLQAALAKAAKPAASSDAADAAASSPAPSADGDDSAPTLPSTRRCAVAPDTLLRHGALGARVAAAARAAASTTSVREAESGLAALKDLLLDELDRTVNAATASAAAAKSSIDDDDDADVDADDEVVPEDVPESVDALRLRLSIALAHLHSGRHSTAHSAAVEAVEAHPHSPAAALVHARCLLRAGKRAEAHKLLELAAEAKTAASAAAAAAAPPKPEVLAAAVPDTPWAREVAGVMLRATKAAERRQVAAADAYDRGSFLDAAAAYREAIACLEGGSRDDVHGRAALHANVAACLRRAKQPAQAVEACDAALALLPRYGRALFRRAVCLLEAGLPAESVAAFEAVYRVDRSWPRLADWLVRAHAAVRRGGGAAASSGAPAATGRRAAARSAEEEAEAAAAAAAEADAATIVRERDHYVVLGVTCDATEKQIKSAYRMRSLKHHPDRVGASGTAAFQRIAEAFAVLSDADKRAAFDQGLDVKAKRKDGGDDDDDEEEREEHKQSLREEIERKYFPEK